MQLNAAFYKKNPKPKKRRWNKSNEAVLEKLGLPVSVVIDTLYRQIIMTGGIPYSLCVPKPQTLDQMAEEQLDGILQSGLDGAKAGRGMDVSEAFNAACEVL